MIKTILSATAIFCSFALQAQYYYHDIIGTREINRQMETFLANNVSKVTATGYTPQGSRADDFAEVQEILENGKTLKIAKKSGLSINTAYYRFDAKTRLVSIRDSSSGAPNLTTYEYDEAGKIVLIKNSVTDDQSGISMEELHRWSYNQDGKVEKMWRTINGTDSLEIRFMPDENGNPGEEQSFRNGRKTDGIYYYFDEQDRITDIVRYNNKVKKLLPDEILTYDDTGRVIQRINSTPGDNLRANTWVGYVIWRYIYDEQGLKTTEALFDSEQHIAGKIKYSYTFGPKP